ncbi:unnamed protein product [Nippostrongylus brasiliensis]|uniref:Pecanex-like protein n=1 Tax=Nippostrongylus brasiliensis TaxID=27835 RepID=A0A0N4YZ33_NIPBR|nr:unnamed protein product [Nippostrongylus brasiliensis]
MLYRACGDEEWLQRARCFGMDPEMISSALYACSQVTTMQEMLAGSVGDQQLCDQYRMFIYLTCFLQLFFSISPGLEPPVACF